MTVAVPSEVEAALLGRTVLLYQSAKRSRRFHAIDCNCSPGDDHQAIETTVRGALALNYHAAPCVDQYVRDTLGGEAASRRQDSNMY